MTAHDDFGTRKYPAHDDPLHEIALDDPPDQRRPPPAGGRPGRRPRRDNVPRLPGRGRHYREHRPGHRRHDGLDAHGRTNHEHVHLPEPHARLRGVRHSPCRPRHELGDRPVLEQRPRPRRDLGQRRRRDAPERLGHQDRRLPGVRSGRAHAPHAHPDASDDAAAGRAAGTHARLAHSDALHHHAAGGCRTLWPVRSDRAAVPDDDPDARAGADDRADDAAHAVSAAADGPSHGDPAPVAAAHRRSGEPDRDLGTDRPGGEVAAGREAVRDRQPRQSPRDPLRYGRIDDADENGPNGLDDRQ